MDISSEYYLDMLLTLLGYLAAVGLGAVVYSMLAQRRRQTAAQAAPSNLEPAARQAPTVSPQFVPLGAVSTETPRPAAASKSEGHSDRVDIIRIAREMLKAGADNKRIQQVLPVSEAELALLNLQNN